jgi:uncharacterized protein (DUF1810 family)
MKYNLDRFITAQDNCYAKVLEEMKNGRKVSHWMWYTFPQIAGLGKSGTAKKYEIANIEEAECYLMDQLLSKRLLELTRILVYEIEGKTIEEIFGFPDCLKFQSSMTLFYLVIISNRQLVTNIHYKCFEDAIRKYFDGKIDNYTLEILKKTTLFSDETPYQFTTTHNSSETSSYKLEYVDLKSGHFKVPVGILRIQNNGTEILASIENAMGPLCWSANKNIAVLPILYIHWWKGFHQKFVSINFKNRVITYYKKIHPGGPRVIEKIHNDSFYFRHFSHKKNEIIEECESLNMIEVEKRIEF